MHEGIIRPLSLGIIRNQSRILVMDGYDSKKEQKFFRLLGGGIDFGEKGIEALAREFREELDTDLENIRFVTLIENVFEFEGKQGHEIVLVFEADITNKDIYQKDSVPIIDSKGENKASWQNIKDFQENNLILYPDTILDYI